MSITLYYGASQDLDAIRDIHVEAYPDETPDRVMYVAKNNPTWLYFDKGIQACLISEISKGLPYVWSVATRATHRGRGMATALLQEFEKHYHAKGYDKLWLHCRVENPAQKTYFDAGYRIASFEPNIYGMCMHGVTMYKLIG